MPRWSATFLFRKRSTLTLRFPSSGHQFASVSCDSNSGCCSAFPEAQTEYFGTRKVREMSLQSDKTLKDPWQDSDAALRRKVQAQRRGLQLSLLLEAENRVVCIVAGIARALFDRDPRPTGVILLRRASYPADRAPPPPRPALVAIASREAQRSPTYDSHGSHKYDPA